MRRFKMGMYSSFVDQDIEVIDKKALLKLKQKNKNNSIYYIIQDDGNIDFSEWDNNKLEGYWYDETKKILKELSKIIKGEVIFLYEEGYQFKIIFKKNRVYFARENEPVFLEETEINLK